MTLPNKQIWPVWILVASFILLTKFKLFHTPENSGPWSPTSHLLQPRPWLTSLDQPPQSSFETRPLKAFLWFCLSNTSIRCMWPPWFLSTKHLLQILKFTPKDSDVCSFSFCSLFCDTEKQTQSLLQTRQGLYHRTLPHSQLPNLSSWRSQAAVNCHLVNVF